MGLKFEVEGISSQNEAIDHTLKNHGLSAGKLVTAIEAFASDQTLQGDTYDSAKAYFSNSYKTLAQLIKTIEAAFEQANQTFLSRYQSEVSEASLDEDELLDDIEKIDKTILRLEDAGKSKKTKASVTRQIEAQMAIKQKLEEKLRKLRAYHTASNTIYEEVNDLLATFQRAVNGVNNSGNWDALHGKFSNTGNFAWLEDAKNAVDADKLDEKLEKRINRPPGMTDKEFKAYKEKVKQEIRYLKRHDGWDEAAIRDGYLSYVNKNIKNGDNWSENLDAITKDTRIVGSRVYEDMFDKSEMDAKTLTDLVVKRHMKGYFDPNPPYDGMLQLGKDGYPFNPNMPPHDKFFEKFAEKVQEAYPNGLDDKYIHQFRYYIDKHNIEYIRNHYSDGGKLNDEEALRAYVKTELKNKMVYEGSRLHDKHPDNMTHEELLNQIGMTKKRLTPNFHSEFIIDKDGNFVSQWNILEKDKTGKIRTDVDYYRDKCIKKDGTFDDDKWRNTQRQIVDTESFNFGKGGNFKQHKNLDMNPPSSNKEEGGYDLDHDLRKRITHGKGNDKLPGWSAPTTEKEYKEKIKQIENNNSLTEGQKKEAKRKVKENLYDYSKDKVDDGYTHKIQDWEYPFWGWLK